MIYQESSYKIISHLVIYMEIHLMIALSLSNQKEPIKKIHINIKF